MVGLRISSWVIFSRAGVTIGAADGLYSNRLTLQVVFEGKPHADDDLHMRYRQHTVETLLAGLVKNYQT